MTSGSETRIWRQINLRSFGEISPEWTGTVANLPSGWRNCL